MTTKIHPVVALYAAAAFLRLRQEAMLTESDKRVVAIYEQEQAAEAALTPGERQTRAALVEAARAERKARQDAQLARFAAAE